MNGTAIVLSVLTSTGPDVWTVVGSQRDVTFDESTAEINMSSKDTRAAKADPGRYSATLTLDALYVTDDAAYLALKAAMRNGTKVSVRRVESGVTLESALAVITNLGTRGPDQAEATVSIALTIDGEWTPA